MYWAVKVGILKTNYEIHCPRCGDRVKVVNRQIDIPEVIKCNECGYKFNPFMHQDKIIISFNINKQ
jgi:C4-type Zn-finger protein